MTSPGESSRRALPREEFGDAFVARDVTFAAEHAPVHGQRRQAERVTMMGERVEKGIGRARNCPAPDCRRCSRPTRTSRSNRAPYPACLGAAATRRDAFGAITVRMRSRVSAASGASSITIAR